MKLPAFLLAALSFTAIVRAADSIPATGADGRVLNLGFEDGTLRDWTATGDAFEKQPVRGEIDQTRPYGKGKTSNHQGQYWFGGYEVHRSDKGKGTLTSVAFKVTQPWASFLVGGGSLPGVRVEIVTKDDGKVIHVARGHNDERMGRSVVDLRKLQGRDIFIRIVDEETVGWGHVNFDDFIFHAEEPKFPAGQLAKAPAKVDPNLKPDDIPFAGIPAEKAAQVATVPAGYELKVFAAEPDIVNPIAFCMDDRARVWVVEGMTYPQRVKTEPGEPEWLGGKDRILVFEDTDGDGKADKRTVFMEGLNLVSGIEVGFGGVFVGAAPNLIFIPVENWDDPKPGKVEVLLDGWGTQDTHETLNTFKWGPDGWLYGCHGVFTKSLVGKPGTPMPGTAASAADENAEKQLRAELAGLEKEMHTREAEKTAFEKRVNVAWLKDEAIQSAESIAMLQTKIVNLQVDLESIAVKQDVQADKARRDKLQTDIRTWERIIGITLEKGQARTKALAEWEGIQGGIEKTKQRIENIQGRLRALPVVNDTAQKTAGQRTALNAGIWRWHPQRKEFEVFAHGTSNPWGIDWNADGDLFAEACVIPHLFHIIQGARYHRQAGQHFDPHTYDDIKTIADHRHFLGATPHGGNGRSDSAGGGHAHAGLCIPQHPSWPDGIRGSVLMNNIHGARINMDVLERKGRGYVAHHGADFINFHDKASQIVDLREGPDGTLFMIDWYDNNQCHRPQREVHDYTTGRIFRLGKKGQKVAQQQIGKMNVEELAKAVWDADDVWVSKRAVRILQERAVSVSEVKALSEMLAIPTADAIKDLRVHPAYPDETSSRVRQAALIHSLNEADRGFLEKVWKQPPRLLAILAFDPVSLGELIRNACAAGKASDDLRELLLLLGKKHESPIVRLALASACQRLTVEQRKPIVLALLAHGEDADDHNLPLMVWYAAEPIVAADPAWAAEALAACKIPKVSEFIARRLAEK